MNTTRYFLTPTVFSGLIIKNRRKAFGFNYVECQLLDKEEILFKLMS